MFSYTFFSFLKQHIFYFILFRYYEIDDIVVREFLGKKLSSKHRKDLDEVSEKTSIAIKSCRLVSLLLIRFKLCLLINLF